MRKFYWVYVSKFTYEIYLASTAQTTYTKAKPAFYTVSLRNLEQVSTPDERNKFCGVFIHLKLPQYLFINFKVIEAFLYFQSIRFVIQFVFQFNKYK